MIRTLMDDDFLIIQVFVKPTDAGHDGVARWRTYIYLSHKETGRYLHDVNDLYEEVSRRITKVVKTRPSDYLVATDQQIALEAMRTAARNGITYQHDTCMQRLSVLTRAQVYQ